MGREKYHIYSLPQISTLHIRHFYSIYHLPTSTYILSASTITLCSSLHKLGKRGRTTVYSRYMWVNNYIKKGHFLWWTSCYIEWYLYIKKQKAKQGKRQKRAKESDRDKKRLSHYIYRSRNLNHIFCSGSYVNLTPYILVDCEVQVHTYYIPSAMRHTTSNVKKSLRLLHCAQCQVKTLRKG